MISPADERIKGAFSLTKASKVGSGTTAKSATSQVFFYAEEDDEGRISIRPVNASHVPTGPSQSISRERLLSDYFPEPEYYQKSMYPSIRQMAKALAAGDKHLKNGEPFTAEMKYREALGLDEQSVRANFGIGLAYLGQGQKDKAAEVLKRLSGLDAAFEPKHKHLFNSFGISLRKNGMSAEALDFYTRALGLGQDDENLRYNIARAHIECGDLAQAAESLKQALEINADMPEAWDLLAKVEKRLK